MDKSRNVREKELWAGRFAKRHADEINFRAMAEWVFRKRKRGRPPCFITLPAEGWLWEQNYLEIFGGNARFVGVERDRMVRRRCAKEANRLNGIHHGHASFYCHPTAEDVGVVFQKYGREEVDMVYLDWMGSWSHEKLQAVDNLFGSGILGKDAMFRFTVSLNRGKPDIWKDKSSDFHYSGLVDIRGGGKSLPEWRLYGIPGIVHDRAAQHGRKASVVSSQVYVSRTGGLGRGVPEMSTMLHIK